jgi:hypothetical protein
MYVDPDYPTKKAFKEAVARGVQHRPYQPAGLGPAHEEGTVNIEGPHYPKPHTWYAECKVERGIVVKVK